MHEVVGRERGADGSVGLDTQTRLRRYQQAFACRPAHGRDTCYIAVHQYAGMEFAAYFRAVEAIMDDYVGRPNWGKRHYQTVGTLRGRYPGWDRFAAVRDRNRVFLNGYTRRVLGE